LTVYTCEAASASPGRCFGANQRHRASTCKAFGDVEFTIDGLIALADEVAVRGTATSNHKRVAYRFPPTGKRITFHGLASLRIADGKIVRFDGFSEIFPTLSNES
jgi:predicted ester cyclase